MSDYNKPLDELDIHQLIKRLESLERTDLNERLSYIEKQLKHFAYAAHSIDKSFAAGIKVSVDELEVQKTLRVMEPLKEVLNILKQEVLTIRQLREEIESQVRSDTVIGTLKFMAKELHELVKQVNEIKEEGIKKDLHLAFSVDGYEMVKRKKLVHPEIEVEDIEPEEALHNLLNSIDKREKIVITHRFGLFGETKKTLKATGQAMGISRERVVQIQHRGIRKLRHDTRKELRSKITHLELIKELEG